MKTRGGRDLAEADALFTALDLAEGFELFAVESPDDTTTRWLRDRLSDALAEIPVVPLDLMALSETAGGISGALQGELERAARPCVFFAFGTPKRDNLSPWLLLNQRRERLARAADAPFVLVLTPADWRALRREAPDLWSIRRSNFRFEGDPPEPLRLPEPLRSGETEVRPPDLSAMGIHSAPQMSPAPREATLPGFLELRGEALAVLVELLKPGARVAVVGGPGVGKTTLARAAAQAVAARYPGGLIEVFAGSAANGTFLAQTAVLALGPGSADAPLRRQARTEAVAAILRDRPSLILVDPASGLDSPGEFPCPPGSTLLLVLPVPPADEGVAVLPMERFTLAEMELAFLRRAPGLDAARARRLARRTGCDARRFTLAWGLLGGGLASPLLAALEDAMEGSDQEMVAVLVQRLPAIFVNLGYPIWEGFAALAAFADDVPPEDLSAIVGPEDNAGQLMERCDELGWLTLNTSGRGHVGLHPILRDVSDRLLTSSPQHGWILLRHATYYLDRLRQDEPGADAWLGPRWREVERGAVHVLSILSGDFPREIRKAALDLRGRCGDFGADWLDRHISPVVALLWFSLDQRKGIGDLSAVRRIMASRRRMGDVFSALMLRPLTTHPPRKGAQSRLTAALESITAGSAPVDETVRRWKALPRRRQLLFDRSFRCLLGIIDALNTVGSEPSATSRSLRSALPLVNTEPDPEIRHFLTLRLNVARILLWIAKGEFRKAEAQLLSNATDLSEDPVAAQLLLSVLPHWRLSGFFNACRYRETLEHMIGLAEKRGDRALHGHAMLSLYYWTRRHAWREPPDTRLLEAATALHDEALVDDFPDYVATIHEIAASAFASAGDFERAVRHAEEAVRLYRVAQESATDATERADLDGDILEALASLATIYLAAERRPQASATIDRWLEVDRASALGAPNGLDEVVAALQVLDRHADGDALLQDIHLRSRLPDGG